jgi:DNA-binding response OmpR family regulator
MNNDEARASVLIIDDNVKNLQVLADILRARNYKVAMAKDGFDALKFISKITPDLILLDIMMPEMDGFEVCRRLKDNEVTKDIPIIFISALDNVSDKVRGFQAGGVDYITKPFQQEEVIARVETHLKLKQSNEKLRQMNEELNFEIQERRRAEEAVRKAKKEITDSIQYAEMIQRSLLPNPEEVKNFLPESFFLWMPKDIVGGDIYFADHRCYDAGFVIAVIDCTGHGVPGAFMTMIASSALRRIITDEGCRDPAVILKQLNFTVKKTLHQDKKYAVSDDGMDAAVCVIRGQGSEVRGQGGCEKDNNDKDTASEKPRLIFAGAKLPLFCVFNEKVTVIRGDKQSIGYKKSDLDFNFTNHTVNIEKGMSFYMATDGFEDQMGENNPRQSRFKYSRFSRERLENLFGEISKLSFERQRETLIEVFETYKGEAERQDDVTVVGFRVI